jgi:hypothetical protein
MSNDKGIGYRITWMELHMNAGDREIREKESKLD